MSVLLDDPIVLFVAPLVVAFNFPFLGFAIFSTATTYDWEATCNWEDKQLIVSWIFMIPFLNGQTGKKKKK
jgi:hypothetical protein